MTFKVQNQLYKFIRWDVDPIVIDISKIRTIEDVSYDVIQESLITLQDHKEIRVAYSLQYLIDFFDLNTVDEETGYGD